MYTAARLSALRPARLPYESAIVARLEDDLGVSLFDRQGRRIRLNQFGRAFLGRVDRALAQLEGGRREVADLAGLEHGQVALAATALRWVPELLQVFLARHPHVWRVAGEPDPVPLHIEAPTCQRILCLAWRDDRYLSAAARQFREFVFAYFARLP